MGLPAHTFSPAGCQCVCGQGAALVLTLLVLLPRGGGGRAGQEAESPQHLQIFHPQHLKPSDQEQWPGLRIFKLNKRRRKHWPTYALVQSSWIYDLNMQIPLSTQYCDYINVHEFWTVIVPFGLLKISC